MKSVNLPAYLNLETRGDGGKTYYAGLELHRPAISVLGYSEKEVKAKLTKDIEEKLTLAVNTERNYQRYIIGTASGCVFIVSYRHNHWVYDICGPGKDYGSSCIGLKDYKGAIEDAINHARADFGGIVYEHSF